jgi:hypothetical protein
MSRKRIFADRRGRDAFLSARRPSPTFDEVDLRKGPRKAPLRGGERNRHRIKSLMARLHGRDKTGRRAKARKAPLGEPEKVMGPGRPESRGLKLSGIHVALGFAGVAILVFFIYFLFFVLPSPIGGLSPAKGTFVRVPVVNLKATFKRDIKPSQISFTVDGKDAITDARVSNRVLSGQVTLQDGRHRATVQVDRGGLMGKRSASWHFNVDTSPPRLTILGNSIKDIKDTQDVEVTFKGKTDKNAVVKLGKETLKQDSNGIFKGSVVTPRAHSLKISATDRAGNRADTYLVSQKRVPAKGVHVSIPMAASNIEMEDMIDLVNRTELNALQIDLKDEWGQIGFLLDNDLAKKAQSTRDDIELEALVDLMRFHNVYSICRIVVFKDPKLIKAKPGLAVQDKGGGIWGKAQWLDPYSKEVWDYNMAVAVAAARAGFNEVQFDYVRFPSDGDTSSCLYPKQDSRKPGQVIDDFMAYARERLSPYNVFISADLFGLTASDQGEMNIGQNVGDVAKRIDYISPMEYPSHYNTGEYGIKSPENNPYTIVSKSLADFKKKISGTRASLRPWLQDFSLRVAYTPDMVRAQINATEKAGINQWLLWDPECTYSEQALKKVKQ